LVYRPKQKTEEAPAASRPSRRDSQRRDDERRPRARSQYHDRRQYVEELPPRRNESRQRGRTPTKRAEQAAPVYQDNDADSVGEEEIPEDYEEPLTRGQQEFVDERVQFCAKKVSILKPAEVRRICVEFEFEADKIDTYLQYYIIDDKYKDVPAFQWQETLTREQKAQMRRRKLLEAERKRRAVERLRRIREERKQERKKAR